MLTCAEGRSLRERPSAASSQTAETKTAAKRKATTCEHKYESKSEVHVHKNAMQVPIQTSSTTQVQVQVLGRWGRGREPVRWRRGVYAAGPVAVSGGRRHRARARSQRELEHVRRPAAESIVVVRKRIVDGIRHHLLLQDPQTAASQVKKLEGPNGSDGRTGVTVQLVQGVEGQVQGLQVVKVGKQGRGKVAASLREEGAGHQAG